MQSQGSRASWEVFKSTFLVNFLGPRNLWKTSVHYFGFWKSKVPTAPLCLDSLALYKCHLITINNKYSSAITNMLSSSTIHSYMFIARTFIFTGNSILCFGLFTSCLPPKFTFPRYENVCKNRSGNLKVLEFWDSNRVGTQNFNTRKSNKQHNEIGSVPGM